jgi:nitroreductase
MNFKDLCEKRYSVRKYSDETVSDESLNYILECVRLAPSGVNFQPWKFVVAKSKEAREKICKSYKRDWLQTAPVIVIAYKNTDEQWVRKYDGKEIGDVDVAIAVEHLCLAAAEKDLGTCWICNFDPAQLNEDFPVESNLVPVALIPVGHIAADCPENPKKRKSLDEITETI